MTTIANDASKASTFQPPKMGSLIVNKFGSLIGGEGVDMAEMDIEHKKKKRGRVMDEDSVFDRIDTTSFEYVTMKSKSHLKKKRRRRRRMPLDGSTRALV